MNMLFTNTKGYSNVYMNTILKTKDTTLLPNTQNNNQPIPSSSTSLQSIQKPMKWGEPVWFFFHTIAQKIKEDRFNIIKKDLLNIIYTVCSNLPCPSCASHAIEYMNKINFNAIQNVEQLKDLFFVFHNSVNVRKNFPIFLRKDLDEKYSKANTINIIQNFFNTFQYKNSNMHMIANNMHRLRSVNFIKEWFNNNIQHFDM